ncbi:DMT family transporter [Sphingobium algorifonticola]|uniref:Guanidinium exporter n=1 Tax=Sphingobium algorifonticola TaxID=2008318 RepID=A0A437JDF7_9SPHN|nr:multidrug efflux SMR transporter [Sphingobium algorifonticola]RVT43921.1 multidrug efflux SMR transporter [Sphingobium algorifonticola]
MAWLMLLGAGLFEVGFTTCLRYADGFRHLGWSAGFLVCAFISFSLLDQAARTIPLGTAYAIWVGIGAVGTLLVGVATGAESLGIVRLGLILLLVACIVGLKLTGDH